MTETDSKTLWTSLAWLPDGWQENVLLRIGDDGRWSEVTPGVPAPQEGVRILPGPVLPGQVDAHSHAFQRAFAGMAERRTSATDTFWSWRDRMYRVAERISPEQLRAIAAQLYVELLQGGYTQVCEFHYLQRNLADRPEDASTAMNWALADAAQDAGIGLTVLPALYERAGFRQDELRPDQRRFANTAAGVWSSVNEFRERQSLLLQSGIAIHSLRAASPDSIHALMKFAADFDGPIHIHVSEQTAEVDECIATRGMRPIEWLERQDLLDERWHLVHATHTVADELDAVARRGAKIVICPSTEANLGDGLPDTPGILSREIAFTVGSDSQVTRDWREELRWLDYAQRLSLRERNPSASPSSGRSSTAERLYARTLMAGAAAAGLPSWGLQQGARADALVVDTRDPALLGIPSSRLLDALVFSSPGRPWRDVMVAGEWVLRDGSSARLASIASRFETVMQALWND